jgi:microcystin-dependent protein
MAFLGIAPTGTVLPFAGSTAPEGWALCDGSAISRTIYSKLFGVIATTYGVGDNSSTFNVPDMRGIYPRGTGTNGTANYGGVTGHTPAGGALAAKGGQKTAKNGLSNSTSTTSSSGNRNQFDRTSGWISADHAHGGWSGGQNSNHYHSTNTGWQVYGGQGGQGITFGGSYSGPNTYNPDTGWASGDHAHYTWTGGVSSNHNHTTTWDGTFSVSGTTPAQTIAGDIETTPAFLALNYIIKL